MLHSGFGPVATGRGVLLQLNDRPRGMFAFIGWWARETGEKPEIQRKKITQQFPVDCTPSKNAIWETAVTDSGIKRTRREERKAGGIKASHFRGLNRCQRLISFLIYDAEFVQHMYFCALHLANNKEKCLIRETTRRWTVLTAVKTCWFTPDSLRWNSRKTRPSGGY